MKTKKIVSLVLASMMAVSSLAACNQGNNGGGGETDPTSTNGSGEPATSEIVDMTFFAAMSGKEKNDGNEIKEIIAQKTGVRVKESWLTGQDAGEAIGSIIASGKLPDFIDGGDGCIQLYENQLLVAWDDYLEKYPNLKEMYTDEEWDKFRMDDGKIYWANVFGNHYKVDTTTGHNGEAFWIQARVLEWDNYPKIETLDQYFDLLERYAAANPTMPDGTPVIPYTCLCEGWKYYCLENAPMFLDGYPNDGCVIVEVTGGADTAKVVDYNTTPTAKMYFKKLNEEFNKGAVDADFATQTYDEYIAKLSTGRVLGLCDQYWDFAYNIMGPFSQTLEATDGSTYRLDEMGCDYVPLGLVAKEGMEQQWHSYGDELNQASGIAVTTSCKNPDLAFAFLNAMLDQEIHDLRFWGIEGEDYLVDEKGEYYRTEEMRENWKSDSYKAKHTCEYSYFPQWNGMSKDGINYMQPAEQPAEFLAGLAAPLKKCFEAYGAGNYTDMVGSIYCDQYPWYPLWSWSNGINNDTEGGIAWQKMGEVKHLWLPKVVMSKDFESDWSAYMAEYDAVNPKAFLDEAQAEVNARLATAKEHGYTG